MRFLEVGTGSAQRILALRNQQVTIGRSDENDLILAQDPTVSRRHAVLSGIFKACSVTIRINWRL